MNIEKKKADLLLRIHEIQAEIRRLKAELSYLERQRDQEAYQKFMRTHS